MISSTLLKENESTLVSNVPNRIDKTEIQKKNSEKKDERVAINTFHSNTTLQFNTAQKN